MDDKMRLSYSRIQTFLHCRRKFHFIYNENLQPKKKSRALKVGDIVHQLLHVFRLKRMSLEDIQDLEKVMDLVKTSYPDDDIDDILTISNEASILVSGYIAEFQSDPLQVMAGETMLEVDLGEFILVGRLDAWARSEDKRLWRVEYKTTGRMDKHYLDGLKSGLQGAIYDFQVEHLFSEKVSGTVYDLLVKTKVPSYHRRYARCDRGAIERMLETVNGVYRSIMRGDFYPSSKCYIFGGECPFKILCDHDSPSARESFYTRRKEMPIEPLPDDVSD